MRGCRHPTMPAAFDHHEVVTRCLCRDVSTLVTRAHRRDRAARPMRPWHSPTVDAPSMRRGIADDERLSADRISVGAKQILLERVSYRGDGPVRAADDGFVALFFSHWNESSRSVSVIIGIDDLRMRPNTRSSHRTPILAFPLNPRGVHLEFSVRGQSSTDLPPACCTRPSD